MGTDINQVEFSVADLPVFSALLEKNLAELDRVLSTPGFGEGAGSVVISTQKKFWIRVILTGGWSHCLAQFALN